MVRPKEWLLTIPRTAVEGGEDILMRDSTPLATSLPLTILMTGSEARESLVKSSFQVASSEIGVHE
jgi:hypothetical protein